MCSGIAPVLFWFSLWTPAQSTPRSVPSCVISAGLKHNYQGLFVLVGLPVIYGQSWFQISTIVNVREHPDLNVGVTSVCALQKNLNVWKTCCGPWGLYFQFNLQRKRTDLWVYVVRLVISQGHDVMVIIEGHFSLPSSTWVRVRIWPWI